MKTPFCGLICCRRVLKARKLLAARFFFKIKFKIISVLRSQLGEIVNVYDFNYVNPATAGD